MTDTAEGGGSPLFSLEMKVRDYECDLQQIVNNAVYQHYFEHTRHEFLLQFGIDFASLHRRGIDLVVVRAELDYHYPLRSGDRFVVTLNVERKGAIRFLFRQSIFLLPERRGIVTGVFPWGESLRRASCGGGGGGRRPQPSEHKYMSKKIFFLVGEDEYHSARTIPPFAEQVAGELGCEAVLSVGVEADPLDLSGLADAALLVMAVRFRNPTQEQLRQLHDWFASGRPAVGLRTTSHAFSNARGWCPDYFGGHYMSHAPNQQGTLAVVYPPAASHPIVRDLPRVTEMGYGGTYNAVPLADTATPLMFGKTGELPAEPVAWVNRYTPSSRVFFSSLGSAEHFEVPTFIQLLRNAIVWCLGEGDGGAAPGEGAGVLPPPPRRPPHSATVLFTGAPLTGWRHWDPGRQPPGMRLDRRAESTAGGQRFDAGRWPAAGNVLTAVPGYGDIYSEARFGAHRLHLEFQLPQEPEWVPGTVRGTGGVFVAGRYEIELRGPAPESAPEYRCGALNGLKAPDVDAVGASGTWQELEVEYDGGRLSVWLNGSRIHHDVVVTEPTPRGFTELPEAWQGKGPLRLQADAAAVRFANIWVSE